MIQIPDINRRKAHINSATMLYSYMQRKKIIRVRQKYSSSKRTDRFMLSA